jgi:hypothetical protein
MELETHTLLRRIFPLLLQVQIGSVLVMVGTDTALLRALDPLAAGPEICVVLLTVGGTFKPSLRAKDEVDPRKSNGELFQDSHHFTSQECPPVCFSSNTQYITPLSVLFRF